MTGVGQHYEVQVLVPQRVPFDAFAIVSMLRTWRSDVWMTACDHEHLSIAIETGDLPTYVQIFHAPPDDYAARLNDALLWSPTWHERWDETARRCPASFVIAMTTQRPTNYASLLVSFLAVLDTVLASLHEYDREQSVLHWIPAKQLLTYAHYQKLRRELGPSGPAVNVRIANATGRPGELLADTIGLAELGLPDLQTSFSDRDPVEVTRKLRGYAGRLFVGDRLDCTWIEEASFVPPERDVLTLELD